MDVVVIFDQDSPIEIIKQLQPDIYAKGGDYTIDGVVGREVVEGYGGKVVTLSLISGRSTTDLIGKIQTAPRR